MKKHIEVVAAVIIKDKKILCVQRPENKFKYISYKYEFPGGKVEQGESNTDAIIREIKEELKMDIIVDEEYITVNHEYPDFKITMYSFICSSENEYFELTEHIDFKWLNTDELKSLDWAAADIPIVKKLMGK